MGSVAVGRVAASVPFSVAVGGAGLHYQMANSPKETNYERGYTDCFPCSICPRNRLFIFLDIDAEQDHRNIHPEWFICGQDAYADEEPKLPEADNHGEEDDATNDNDSPLPDF